MAQEDFFLKIEGIEGESSDSKHKGEIQISSFSFGVTNSGTGGAGGGSGAGKVNVQDIHVTKVMDKSSPNLFIGCCTGKHYNKATLTIRKAGEKPLDYLVYNLTEVMVSSHSVSGHEGGGIAQESVSLNFAKVEMVYTPQKADGSGEAKISKAWDLAKNVAT